MSLVPQLRASRLDRLRLCFAMAGELVDIHGADGCWTAVLEIVGVHGADRHRVVVWEIVDIHGAHCLDRRFRAGDHHGRRRRDDSDRGCWRSGRLG